MSARSQPVVIVGAGVSGLCCAAGDQATADLGVRRIEIHEKNAWMLRSHLE